MLISNSPKAFSEFIGSLFQFWGKLFPILDTEFPLFFSLVFSIFSFSKFYSPLNLCFTLILPWLSLAQLGPAWPNLLSLDLTFSSSLTTQILLTNHSNFCSLFSIFLICCLVLTCPNLPKLAQTCPKLAQTYPNMPKLVQTCPKLPKLAQNCRNLP